MQIDRRLRFYVRDYYSTSAGKNGGSEFKPHYKKDIKTFKIRVKYAVNRITSVLNDTWERYPITLN